MATPRVRAGALFVDDYGRVLLVEPSYKSYWDVPGGYVEPGESPFCRVRASRDRDAVDQPDSTSAAEASAHANE